VQLTRDDTLANEALLLGDLKPEEVADFPHKSIVLSALGMAATTRSVVTSVALRLDDALLLCTDGLHALVDRRTIRAVLLRHREPGVAARVLVDEAMRAGGNDNLALVVARFEASYLVPPQPTDALKDEALPG
jgi:protein phosphatase